MAVAPCFGYSAAKVYSFDLGNGVLQSKKEGKGIRNWIVLIMPKYLFGRPLMRRFTRCQSETGSSTSVGRSDADFSLSQ